MRPIKTTKRSARRFNAEPSRSTRSPHPKWSAGEWRKIIKKDETRNWKKKRIGATGQGVAANSRREKKRTRSEREKGGVKRGSRARYCVSGSRAKRCLLICWVDPAVDPDPAFWLRCQPKRKRKTRDRRKGKRAGATRGEAADARCFRAWLMGIREGEMESKNNWAFEEFRNSVETRLCAIWVFWSCRRN